MPLPAAASILRASSRLATGYWPPLPSHRRSCAWRAAPASPAVTMGQKSIDAFFKKPASTAAKAGSSGAAGDGDSAAAQQAAATPAAAGAAAAAQPAAELAPAAGVPPQPAATAAAAGDGATAAVVAAAEAAAAPAPATEPGNVAEAQATERQQMRAHANRNAALAKQVVLKAEAQAGVPRLAELLIEDSWRQALAPEFQKQYWADLERYVQSEWRGSQMVFPPKDCIFRALNSCPLDKVKVVILGQDPYHDLGQAMGLSFSVPQGKQIPSSLRNMYKELREDLGCDVPKHGNLEKWAHQGVLLLNAVLTVRAHSAASHAKKGWEKFTDEAISQLSKRRHGVVFLLWGRYAQEKGKVIDKKKHHVLTAAHPSGLSANRGFFGCRHFSAANQLLQQEGQLPIDWCIE